VSAGTLLNEAEASAVPAENRMLQIVCSELHAANCVLQSHAANCVPQIACCKLQAANHYCEGDAPTNLICAVTRWGLGGEANRARHEESGHNHAELQHGEHR
jgi:hypothetical protein